MNTFKQRFEIVTRSTRDVIYDWDVVTNDVWWNENFETVFGYPADQVGVDADAWIERIHPEDAPGILKIIHDAFAGTENTLSFEYRFRQFDGSYAFVFDRGQILRDDQGKPARMIGAMQDLTERKMAEKVLQRTETLYRRAIAGAGAVPYSLDYTTRSYFFIGEGIEQLIGYPTGEITPQLWKQIIQESVMLGETSGLPRDEAARRVAAGELRTWRCDMRVLTREGKSRWISDVSVQNLDESGRPTGSMGILQDITERKEAEEELRKSESQFRLVWNASADGMRLTNREGIVLTVNDAYCQMVGKSKTELEGQSLAIVHDPKNAARVLERHKEQVDSNAAQLHLEREVTLWDGRKLWLDLTNSLLRSPGQPLLLLTIFRDITQRKQAEAEMAEMHSKLVDASRQAGMAEVATSVLHNVGNVLNSINVSGSMIREKIKKSKAGNLAKVVKIFEEHATDLPGFFSNDPRSKQLPAYLSQLTAHLEREKEDVLHEIASLVGNIEHIKEIVAMQQSYAKVSGLSELVPVIDLVEDAVRMNTGALQRHRVRLVRDYSDVPPILVEKHKVLQILVNLIRNAKYACDESNLPDKQLTLRITGGEGRIQIAVIDNGVGIPAENLTRIFNHGFTTRKEGHGFGLHSGALAAKELGGSLDVQSDGPGKGAVFTLELPVNQHDSL